MKPHTLVAFGGTLPNNEEWSITARVLQPGLSVPIAEESLDTYLRGPGNPTPGGIATGFAGIFNGSSMGVHPSNRLTWAKANNIGADGKYTSDVTHVWDYPSPIIGGGANTALPPMCSVAWSWSTSLRTRGPASKGRLYPPNNGIAAAAGGDGIITPAMQATQLTAARAFLTMLAQGSGAITAQPVLISTVSDAWAPIDRVRIGRVVDVQRRRKNQITENYVTGNWPA